MVGEEGEAAADQIVVEVLHAEDGRANLQEEGGIVGFVFVQLARGVPDWFDRAVGLLLEERGSHAPRVVGVAASRVHGQRETTVAIGVGEDRGGGDGRLDVLECSLGIRTHVLFKFRPRGRGPSEEEKWGGPLSEVGDVLAEEVGEAQKGLKLFRGPR